MKSTSLKTISCRDIKIIDFLNLEHNWIDWFEFNYFINLFVLMFPIVL